MKLARPAYIKIICLVLSGLSFYAARATHIVGGEVTYKFMGSATGDNIYKVSLTIYEDCLNGSPSAIAADNPAYIAVFAGSTQLLLDSANFASSVQVPANFTNACVSNIPPVCLLKKTFNFTFALPPNSIGYTIGYQRCCRNAAIQNIVQPANFGATYFCTIPPVSVTDSNNSAVFTNFPPQIICVNTPLLYNNSATDADGDSLSYELCSSYTAPNGLPSDDIIPPPFQYAQYLSPFSFSTPLTAYPAIQIDPVSGIITGTPNRVGRYLVTVCCHEWRNGQMINTIQREFQFVVTNCTKAVQPGIPVLSSLPNTYELNCTDYTIHFINTSKGGITWKWDFGVPGATDDTSNEFEPTFVYPDTGTYTVKLIVNPGSTCADSIIRLVSIYPVFKTDFANTGTQCAGNPILFLDQSESTVKPVLFWQWYFGDGDSSAEENPAHSYHAGGAYNVVLVSRNIKSCTDTSVQQLIIDHFSPFAGNDTTIIKGESILFNASGGSQYTWSPATNLSDTTINNPTGFYPDTGHFTYYVYVVSPYGCSGYDTIQVTVVNQAAFFVPTAFTPNGDGKNDLFRPIAIGYRALNYFRVFNRWGQEVYFGQNLETGWDGTYSNKQADMGTYFWEISFTDRFGKPGSLKGDVTLLR